LQVLVRDNNVDQALRVLKKKMQREGVFREMKQRRSYEKPSERKVREKSEAIRRARKLARKKAQREGLIPDTRKKKIDDKRTGGRPGMGGRTSGGFGGGGGMGGGSGFGGGGERSGPPRF
jgi:small subunit ribosomal protein S21